MSRHLDLSSDASTVTITVPLAIRRRGGRKEVIAPEGAPALVLRHPKLDSTMVKALARAFRWRRLLEDEVYVSCEELAAAEKINPSYVSRILRLTLLAPDFVEVILDGRQPADLTMERLLKPFPIEWEEQSDALRLAEYSTWRQE